VLHAVHILANEKKVEDEGGEWRMRKKIRVAISNNEKCASSKIHI
jgi:hypothetical protein